MNEELKIIIKAITDEAQKEIAEIRKELDKVKQSTKETEGSMSKLSGVAKTVGKTLASAFAVKKVYDFGKSCIELGSNLAEVQNVVDNVYGSMSDKVNQFAKSAMTSYGLSEKVAKDYMGTLGAMSKSFGNSTELAYKQAEALTALTGDVASFYNLDSEEAFNKMKSVFTGETEALKSLGVVMTETALNEFALANGYGKTVDKMSEQEKVGLRLAFVQEKLTAASGDFLRTADGYANQSRVAALRLEELKAQIGQTLIPAITGFKSLAVVFMQILAPAIQTVSNVFAILFKWIYTAANGVASLFGKSVGQSKTMSGNLSSMNSSLKGVSSGLGSASKGAGGLDKSLNKSNKEASKLKKSLMGFDELNVVSPVDTSSGATGGGSAGGNMPSLDIPTIEPIDFGLDKVKTDIGELEEKMKAVLTLAGLVGTGIAAWKIVNKIQEVGGIAKVLELVKGKVKSLAGDLLIIGGAILTVKGYTDAWANGASWGNLAMTIGGIAAVVGGLYLKFGELGAGIGAVAGGVALLVLGVKDFIENGATAKNTILILGGAIATAVGLATAGVSVVVSAIVGAVAAIGAFTAAIILEKSPIMDVKDAQEALNKAKEEAAQAENDYVNAVDASEASLNKLKEAEKKAGVTGESLYKQVQAGTLDYANMTDEQKECYKAYLDNEKKQKDLKESTEKLNEAKRAEKVAALDNELALAKESGSYDKYKKSVVEAFENGEISAADARDAIEKACSEMSDSSQQTFVKDLPSNLQEGLDTGKYETTGKKLKDWFGKTGSEAKTKMTNALSGIGNFFSGLWTNITNSARNLGTRVGDAISGAVKTAINWVLDKIQSTINGGIGLINGAIRLINNLPGVSIGTIKNISIPKLAKGGVIDSATLAVVGEAGKEAVVPLENNTEWMNKLADVITSRSNTPSKVILQVDGKELGWATIHSINGITKQTGGLPLVLV